MSRKKIKKLKFGNLSFNAVKPAALPKCKTIVYTPF